jgi:hypothetical protein
MGLTGVTNAELNRFCMSLYYLVLFYCNLRIHFSVKLRMTTYLQLATYYLGS